VALHRWGRSANISRKPQTKELNIHALNIMKKEKSTEKGLEEANCSGTSAPPSSGGRDGDTVAEKREDIKTGGC
jgi:hypothetical protein